MAGWPDGVVKLEVDTVDSTNSYSAQLIDGYSRPIWVVANHQTNGRGRLGRKWVSDEGNLFTTYLRCIDEHPSVAALRSFVAALAVRDCLVTIVQDRCRISLKWPNDVLANGRKIAGILLESLSMNNSAYILYGIGINLVSSPKIQVLPELHSPANIQEVSGVNVQRDQVLEELALAMQKRERQFEKDGFVPIRYDWLAKADGIGKPVKVRLGDRTIKGILQSVNNSGHAIIDDGSSLHEIVTADLYF